MLGTDTNIHTYQMSLTFEIQVFNSKGKNKNTTTNQMK